MEYLAYLRDPNHGFRPGSLALKEVCEFSVRVAESHGD